MYYWSGRRVSATTRKILTIFLCVASLLSLEKASKLFHSALHMPYGICNADRSFTSSPALILSNNKKLAFCIIGAGDGSRTRNPQLGRLVLYQLSYSRKVYCLESIAPILFKSNVWNEYFLSEMNQKNNGINIKEATCVK